MKLASKVRNRFLLEKKLLLIKSNRLFKKAANPDDQFLLFSDPRGGSTWLAELIKCIPNTALVWEPLHLNHVPDFKKLGFGWRHFIPEGIFYEAEKDILSKAICGKIINEWTMINTTVTEYRMADQFITKFCRGNMLLPWFVNTFNFKYLPIYLLRHPFAVVSSQIRHGAWGDSPSMHTTDKIYSHEPFKKHESFLKKLKTKEEHLVALWCITNNIPLLSPYNNIKWITQFYESLFLEPKKNLTSIFNRWNMSIPESIFEKIEKPSSTSIDSRSIKNPNLHLTSWKKTFSSDQIHSMQNVLEYFNIKVYNSESPYPLKKI